MDYSDCLYNRTLHRSTSAQSALHSSDVLVFYYQKYRTISLKGAIAAIALSGLLIVLILFVYIPGMADIGGWFELLLSMPWDFLSKQD